MHKFLPLVFFFFVSNSYSQSAWFQADKSVTCGPIVSIIEGLISEKYKEIPTWIGKDKEASSRYSLFVNEKTGAWTLVQFGNEIGCILGLGTDSKNIIPKPNV